jgi:hypothetical protein
VSVILNPGRCQGSVTWLCSLCHLPHRVDHIEDEQVHGYDHATHDDIAHEVLVHHLPVDELEDLGIDIDLLEVDGRNAVLR